MNHIQIAEKTAAYLSTFLNKEGYVLLKTEYVKEDGLNYLRAYIDLTQEERENRRAKAEEKKTEGPEITEKAVSGEKEEELTETGIDGGETVRDGETEENAEPGIGINDCAFVSRRLSKWLDKEDFIPDEYTLEVCSKGYLN